MAVLLDQTLSVAYIVHCHGIVMALVCFVPRLFQASFTLSCLSVLVIRLHIALIVSIRIN